LARRAGLSAFAQKYGTSAKIGFLAVTGVLVALYWPDTANTTNASGADAACRITHVIDGDTVDLKCTGTQTERIRLMGYDTPETYYAKCVAEKALGDRATERLRARAASTPVTKVERNGTDRYDRTLARVWLDNVDLAETMVSEQLAVRYSGGKRIDWCARLASSGNN